MPDTRTVLSALLYCLWWPTSKVLLALAFILSPFWAAAHFIFLPPAYLIQGILSIILFPFRLHILERIEAIYIWLGVAAIIGCFTGAVLFLIFKFLTSAFNIDRDAETKPLPNGRTVKEFRSARRVKKDPCTGSSSGPPIDKVARMRRNGLSSQAILEEESEF